MRGDPHGDQNGTFQQHTHEGRKRRREGIAIGKRNHRKMRRLIEQFAGAKFWKRYWPTVRPDSHCGGKRGDEQEDFPDRNHWEAL